MSSHLVRLSGLAAMLAGALGIVLTPILTHLWATFSDTYLYYGRSYFLVYTIAINRRRGCAPINDPILHTPAPPNTLHAA